MSRIKCQVNGIGWKLSAKPSGQPKYKLRSEERNAGRKESSKVIYIGKGLEYKQTEFSLLNKG